MDRQVLTTSPTRSAETGSHIPFVARGLGRVRIAGALRAFLTDSLCVPVYPTGS